LFRYLTTTVAALLLAGIVLVGSALVLFTEPAVWVLLNWTHSQEVATDDSLPARAEVVRSLVTGGDAAVPLDPNGINGLDSRSVEHLLDVKRVVRLAALGVLMAAGLVLALLAGAAGRGSKRAIAQTMVAGGSTVVVVVATLGLAAWASFDFAFERFHDMLFASGTWTFAPDSFLITTFPTQFWINAAVAWGSLALLLAAVIIAIAHKIRTNLV